MNNKIIIIVLVMCIIISMCAFVGTGKITHPYVYVDEENGVNYLVYSVGYKGGMCPRYNSDGTLYITVSTTGD